MKVPISNVKVEFLPPAALRKKRDRPPRVYPLPLVGTGTGEVECLTSYMQRLAAAHNLTTGVFLSKVVRPETTKIRSRLSVKAIHASNGLGKYAREIVHALGTLQRQGGCDGGTLLALSPALDPMGHGLVSSHLKWCWQCWSEDVADESPTYVRLLWTANFVSVCPRHRTTLQVLCPHCGKGQKVCSSYPAASLCQHCWRDLWKEAPQKKLINENSLDLSISRSMFTLIGRMPSLCPEGLRKAFSSNIRRLADELFDGSQYRLSKCIGLDVSQVRSWSKQSNRPSITSVINVSRRIGVPFDQLLTDSDNLIFPDKINPKTKVTRIQKTHISPEEFRRQHQFLQDVIDADTSPPQNLTDVASKLNCNYMTLSKRFPTESQVIRDRASAYRTRMRRQGQLRRLDRVIDAVEQLLKAGSTPSDRHLKQLDFIRPGDIRNPLVREYLVRVRAQSY